MVGEASGMADHSKGKLILVTQGELSQSRVLPEVGRVGLASKMVKAGRSTNAD